MIDQDKLKALRKTDRWYWLKLILWTPFWFLFFSPTKKSWSEFKNSLINHECIYNGEITKSEGTTWQACSHPGCNMICPIDHDHPELSKLYREWNKNK